MRGRLLFVARGASGSCASALRAVRRWPSWSASWSARRWAATSSGSGRAFGPRRWPCACCGPRAGWSLPVVAVPLAIIQWAPASRPLTHRPERRRRPSRPTSSRWCAYLATPRHACRPRRGRAHPAALGGGLRGPDVSRWPGAGSASSTRPTTRSSTPGAPDAGAATGLAGRQRRPVRRPARRAAWTTPAWPRPSSCGPACPGCRRSGQRPLAGVRRDGLAGDRSAGRRRLRRARRRRA